MVFLALNPRVWVVLGVLFLLALLRRLWRGWRSRRRAKRHAGRAPQGSKRP
jgi:hypothetical protein